MPNIYNVYGTIASNTVAASVSLTPRWNYLTVENLAAAGGTVIWVRTDGVAAVKEADNCFPVAPGEAKMLANMAALWTQSATVIRAGSYTNAPVGAPLEIVPMGTSFYGGTANPGTTISVILDSGTTSTPFAVSAAG